jgi:hypothetical protein
MVRRTTATDLERFTTSPAPTSRASCRPIEGRYKCILTGTGAVSAHHTHRSYRLEERCTKAHGNDASSNLPKLLPSDVTTPNGSLRRRPDSNRSTGLCSVVFRAPECA